MFAGIGGFRAGLDRAGGFQCVGHCEIDKYADASYRAIHDIREEELYYPDARKIDPNDLPGFDLLCLTARISVSPRSESGCSLSDILIPDAPEKYFLSSEQTEKLLYKSSAGRRDRESMTPEGPPVHRLPEVEEKE